ncbi:KAP family P-loop domain-containing protein [Candidatus Electrothrix aarhusensis]
MTAMPENADSLIYSHNDEPVLETAFNEEFIARLCGIIRNCRPPKGLAVTGYWGTGKTSTLKQLYYHLTGKLPPGCTERDKPEGGPRHKDVALVPVWFEAWRFQHEQQPIVALLNEIRVKIGLLNRLTAEAGKLGSVALLGSLSIFDEIIKTASGGTATPKTGGIMAIGEKWEKDRYLNKLPSAQISGLLEEAIKKGLGNRVKGKEKRLIIFIDDLDRCLPTASLRLLEGIRIYLNLSNCILVFGMDHRQLEQSLLEALPWIDNKNEADRKQASYYANEYLEKICQDIHQLPLPDLEEKAKYFKSLLSRLDSKLNSDNARESLDHAQFLDQILRQFDCLPANPRKIKMLVNRVALMLREIPPTEEEDVSGDDPVRQYKLLLITAIICTFHKRIYEQLVSNPGYINEVLNYSKADLSMITEDAGQQSRFAPMTDVLPSQIEGERLPVNPSDSNVFRLHELLDDLDVITKDEIEPYLTLRRPVQ